jgi:bifunctional non-homologous end joining protein LigD
MPTTGHDLSYRTFEGVLPEGSYGAGPVMIWDEGTFNPEVEINKGVRKEITDKKEGEEVLKEGLQKGELKFILYGKKLQGSFALVKTKGWGPKDSWLLIKHADDAVKTAYDANDHKESAKSKKTIEEIQNNAVEQ